MLLAADAAEVERHMEGCAGCRAELSRLRALDDLLGEASPPRAPSPGFEAAFLKRLRAEPESIGRRAAIDPAPAPSLWQRLFGGWRGYVFAGAGLAAAAAITFAVTRPQGGSPGEPAMPPSREPVAIAADPDPELLRRLELLHNLEVATHLEAALGLTDEELEAVSTMPGLGG